MDEKILFVRDSAGEIRFVQIPYELWCKVEKDFRPQTEKKEEKLKQQQGPLNDFKTLMEYWDFSYPYSPEVRCPHCGASTDDWRLDKNHTFVLTNASLGGLVVYHCTKCGTTIRHKHFKDHVSYEHTIISKN